MTSYDYLFFIKTMHYMYMYFCNCKIIFANSLRLLYYKFLIAQGKFLYKCK